MPNYAGTTRGNLKRGNPGNKGGRPKEDSNYRKGQKLAQRLLNRPKFLKNLQERCDDGTIHPSVLNTLLYFAFGKPKEEIELKQPSDVRIIFKQDQSSK